MSVEAELISQKDVTFFFNRYKYNSDQIFHLERRLLQESYDYEKWEQMLSANSELTRKLFKENEELLDEYVRPAIKNPDRLKKEVLHDFLLHITFYLFENNIDSHITDDFILSVLEKCPDLGAAERFDALFNLGISRTVARHVKYEEAKKCFEQAEEVFPDYDSVPDDDVRIHIVFCLNFEMICMALYKSDDLPEFIRLYEKVRAFVKAGTKELYARMWGEHSDFESHVNLLMRFFRTYGIFIAGRVNFAFNDEDAEKKECSDIIAGWLLEEYKKESEEGCINPMIQTYYCKLKNLRGEMKDEEFYSTLFYEFTKISSARKYIYPETPFPVDDDPVPPQFSVLLDRIKLLNQSFTFANVLVPELYVNTKNNSVRRQIANELLRYYESGIYAEKGFQTDSFVYENINLISSCFENLAEFVSSLQTIFIHREITSAIHFAMVSNLAVICVSHLIDSAPELFVSEQFPTEEEVRKNRTELIHFCKYAGLLHDIGKIARTNLINLHFRRITEEEFKHIAEHTSLGYEITEEMEFLEPFRDIILGHHKYFDGIHGYPADFDVSGSPKKIFIDLIAICDTVDTATDFKGRNYAAKKTFDDIMKELRLMDTRYSPQLVNLIYKDEALMDELRYMTSMGRNYTSYEMYRQFVLPGTDFSKKDEKTVSLYKPSMHDDLVLLYKKTDSVLTLGEIEIIIDSFDFSELYVLHSRNKKVLGYLAGAITETDGNKVFYIKDMRIDIDYRRRGWGTELINHVSECLKKNEIHHIKAAVPKESNAEGFFWIEGFVKDEQQIMVKEI